MIRRYENIKEQNLSLPPWEEGDGFSPAYMCRPVERCSFALRAFTLYYEFKILPNTGMHIYLKIK